MPILDALRTKLTAAMRGTDERSLVTKDVLRVAIGAIDSFASSRTQGGQPITDDHAIAQLRKIVAGNDETIALCREKNIGSDRVRRLDLENEILGEFLPKTLDTDGIRSQLAAVQAAIKAAGNDGQATGVAMKHLKGLGLAADGKIVGGIVKEIRAT